MHWDQNEIHLPAVKTKAGRDRFLPISQRLRAVLEMRRHDPLGQDFGPDAYVFGDAIGRQVRSIRTAWEKACERAQITGLTFHDLRRESGSRLLEGGVPEHYVQRFLDHANLSTMSRYLTTTRQGMHQVFAKYEQSRKAESESKKARADSSEGTPQASIVASAIRRLRPIE